MSDDLFSLPNLFAYCAALAGGLWGITLQPGFATRTFRSKLWRFVLAVLAAIFTGPYILHRFFPKDHPSVSAFWMFVISTVALAVVPELVKRAVAYSKRVEFRLRDDG